MTALVVVLTASVATWLLRIGFIALVPAERLPARVHRAFDDVAPAVLAAIVVTHVVHAGGPGDLPWETLAAVLAAGVVAWRSPNLALPVVVGVAVFGLLLAAPDLARGSVDAVAQVEVDEPADRADTVRWGHAAQARIARETLAGRDGVAEWSRFLAPDVTVDDRAWTGSRYEGRAAWREQLTGTYGLSLDEVHHQRVLLDPSGALVQQRQDHLAGLGAPAHVVQLREYGPDGIEHLRTSVAIRDLQRRPGGGDRDGFDRSRSSRAATSARGPAARPTRSRPSTRPGHRCATRSPASRCAAVGPSPTRWPPRPTSRHTTWCCTRSLAATSRPSTSMTAARRRPPRWCSCTALRRGRGVPAPSRSTSSCTTGASRGERRFHDPPSARRCLDDLPAGWWSSLAVVGPVDVPSGRMLVDRRPVRLLNSTAELDRLLTWGFQRFETAGLRPPSVGSVTFASGSGRCAGIAGGSNPRPRGARPALSRPHVGVCRRGLRDLHVPRPDHGPPRAGARVGPHLVGRADAAGLPRRCGLEAWYGHRDVPWADRGVEQAAEILMWGLLETPSPLPRLHRPSCESLLAAYRTLTDALPTHGACHRKRSRERPLPGVSPRRSFWRTAAT
jgi:branched-subunit amino acid transport protein